MQTCDHWWVKTTKYSLFIQKCPQFAQKLSASNVCMLLTFSLSGANHIHLPSWAKFCVLNASPGGKLGGLAGLGLANKNS